MAKNTLLLVPMDSGVPQISAAACSLLGFNFSHDYNFRGNWLGNFGLAKGVVGRSTEVDKPCVVRVVSTPLIRTRGYECLSGR